MSLLTKEHSAASAQAYYEMEGNCNTCKHLARVAHAKSPHGFLHGQCLANPFGQMFLMTFHPHDPMHMGCYEDRRSGERCTVAIWRETADSIDAVKPTA
jgi:hypothetical protein